MLLVRPIIKQEFLCGMHINKCYLPQPYLIIVQSAFILRNSIKHCAMYSFLLFYLNCQGNNISHFCRFPSRLGSITLALSTLFTVIVHWNYCLKLNWNICLLQLQYFWCEENGLYLSLRQAHNLLFFFHIWEQFLKIRHFEIRNTDDWTLFKDISLW